MSEAQERLVDEAVRGFNERDIEGLVALGHPDIEIELIGGFADVMGARFQGPEGVRRFYTDWFAIFTSMHTAVEDMREAGEQLVALTRLHATVEGSDAPVELLSAIVFDFEDDRIRRAGFYYDRSTALEAAGLRD